MNLGSEFVNMLNEMRFGKLTTGSVAKFKSLSRPLEYSDGVAATELCVLTHDSAARKH